MIVTVAALREELESRGWKRDDDFADEGVHWYTKNGWNVCWHSLVKYVDLLTHTGRSKRQLMFADYPTASALVDAIEMFTKGE